MARKITLDDNPFFCCLSPSTCMSSLSLSPSFLPSTFWPLSSSSLWALLLYHHCSLSSLLQLHLASSSTVHFVVSIMIIVFIIIIKLFHGCLKQCCCLVPSLITVTTPVFSTLPLYSLFLLIISAKIIVSSIVVKSVIMVNNIIVTLTNIITSDISFSTDMLWERFLLGEMRFSCLFVWLLMHVCLSHQRNFD